MRAVISGIATASLASLALIVGCGRSDNSNSDNGTAGNVPTRASGDSLVIRTTDGTIKLGLVRDTVFMGLTDSVLAVARNDMARDTEESGSAIARTVERLVKRGVSSALQTRLQYPLADIDSAHYDNGTIKFAYRNRRKMAFEDVKRDHNNALSSFSPEDARNFVATLNSAIIKVRGPSR